MQNSISSWFYNSKKISRIKINCFFEGFQNKEERGCRFHIICWQTLWNSCVINNELKSHLLRAVLSFKFSPRLTMSERAETELGKIKGLKMCETECIESQSGKHMCVVIMLGSPRRTEDIRILMWWLQSDVWQVDDNEFLWAMSFEDSQNRSFPSVIAMTKPVTTVFYFVTTS